MSDKHNRIIDAITRLSMLTGEDFHGYHIEIYSVLSKLWDEGYDEGAHNERITKKDDDLQSKV